MSEALEAGYRRVLMMLPRAYWDEHAEEMLAVLMDGAKPGQTRPKAREVLSVAGLALRLRLAVGAGVPGTLAGDIARRAILAYLVFDFALIVQSNAYDARIGYSFLQLLLPGGVIAALILGWSWPGRVLSVAYLAYLIHNMQWAGVRDDYSSLGWYTSLDVFPVLLALAAAVVCFHRRAPRIAGSQLWFLAVAAIGVAFWIRGKTVDYYEAFDIEHTPALPALLYAVAMLIALRQAKSSPVWPAALALAGLPKVAYEAMAYAHVRYPMAFTDSARDGAYLVALIVCECVLVAAALASLTYRLYRRSSLTAPAES